MKTRRPMVLCILVAVCTLAMSASTMLGAEPIGFGDLLAAIGIGEGDVMRVAILRQLRFPRVLLAALVGGALAMSGAGLQALFRNPMADPFFLGVSAGGALGAALAMTLQSSLVWLSPGLVPLCAGLGAMATVSLVYSLGRVGGRVHTSALLLTGIAISTLLTAALSLLMIGGAGDQTAFHMRLHSWTLGGFAGTSGLLQPAFAFPYLALCFVLLYAMSNSLNLLLLGEETAHSVGVNVDRVRQSVLLLSSLLAAASVCMAGIIGFVGLIAPHVARLLVGPDHRWLLPTAAAVGALFLVICDALSRSAQPPLEVPLGVFSALLGVPFFLCLLRRTRSVSL